MEHSPLWNTHFPQGGCLCRRYTACTQTHSPGLPAASAAQIPPPPRCVHRTHTHHTPFHLSIGSAEKHKQQKRHLWYCACWAFDLLQRKSKHKGSLWAEVLQVHVNFHSYEAPVLPLTARPEHASIQTTLGCCRHQTAAIWLPHSVQHPFVFFQLCHCFLPLLSTYMSNPTRQACTLPILRATAPPWQVHTTSSGSSNALLILQGKESQLSLLRWIPGSTGKLWKNWGQMSDFQTLYFRCLIISSFWMPSYILKWFAPDSWNPI